MSELVLSNNNNFFVQDSVSWLGWQVGVPGLVHMAESAAREGVSSSVHVVL